MAGPQRAPGDLIAGYRVLARLGTGGSGSVYRVEGPDGAIAALKLVDARDDEVAAERLAREVRALQSLRHPAVPHILDAELDDDETFVVFELIDGDTLFDYIQREGPLGGEALADFAEQTASALEAAHAAGVIHRDVTPSNIMMGADGPVLIDFGLSHRATDNRLTREGLVSGTPGYVAPEVIDGAEPGTVADRWSWAATVAYAMTAQAPFGAGTGAISRTLEADVRLPDVPGAAAIRAALGRDIAGRPGMRDVVAALRGATEAIPQGLPATVVAPAGYAAGWDDAQRTAVLPSGEAPVGYGPPDGVPAAEPGAWTTGADAWLDQGDGYRVQGDHGDDAADEFDDDLDPDEHEPLQRRRTLLLLTAILLTAAAPIAPVVAVGVLLSLWILARGVFRRAVALEAAFARRGERRTSDTVMQTIGLPWHTLRAAAETIPAALAALLLGGGAAAGGWWLVSTGAVAPLTETGQYYGHAGALALGLVVATVMLAFGPFMSGSREGAHRMAAALSPTSGLRGTWAVILVVGILVSALALYVHIDIWWWPLPDMPGAA